MVQAPSQDAPPAQDTLLHRAGSSHQQLTELNLQQAT